MKNRLLQTLLCIALAWLAGCARNQDIGSLATVDAVLQKDAPVQIVGITPSGDNELAKVTIKNTTGRYVQDMAITCKSTCGILATNLTGEEISIKSQAKRIMFQIGYDEKELNVRAELFRRFGHEVISVPDNGTAKRALTSTHNVDVFVVGYQAPDQTRKEMVDWLKENFPKVKIVALVPSTNRQLPRADYNIMLNDWDEWLSLLATTS